MGVSIDGGGEIMCEIPRGLISDSNLRSSTLRVLNVLYGMCKQEDAHDPFAWPSISCLRQLSGLGKSTVHRALNQAIEYGIAKRERRHGEWGWALAPSTQEKRTLPRAPSPSAQDTQPRDWNEKVSPVGQKSVTSGTPVIPAPSSESPTGETPYNIGIKNLTTPPTPQGGERVELGEPDVDEPAESAPVAQLELVPSPEAKSKAKTRGRKLKPREKLPERDLVRVFEALHEARTKIAEREGLRLGQKNGTPTDRDELAKLIGSGWTVEALLESIENRGRVGGEREFSMLTHHPFSSKVVDYGYKIQPNKQPKLKPTVNANGTLRDLSRG